MLHLVISTPRSGSNSLCRYIGATTGAKNLYEIIGSGTDKYGNLTGNPTEIIKNILSQSRRVDLVVKCHIEHIMLLYPQELDLIQQLFLSAKLYYCVRLNLSDQIKSTFGIELTNVCDQGGGSGNILIKGQTALRVFSDIVHHVSIMGELYKYYPGDIMILEEQSGIYAQSAADSGKYNNKYYFSYDSVYTHMLVERKIDIMKVFKQGNSSYAFI
jgi:hypothetical protein